MHKAQYIEHPIADLRGNPFSEGLGLPLLIDELQERCESNFVSKVNLSATEEKYHSYYRKAMLYNLRTVYVLPDEAEFIYDKLRLMIEFGYLLRNPLKLDAHNKLLLEVHQEDPEKSINESVPFRVGRSVANMSFLLTGLSGRGKTTLVTKLLDCIPQVICHEKYKTPDGTVVDLSFEQISYLYVELHARKGQKAFLDAILEALDGVAGTNYVKKSKSLSVNRMITLVRKAFIVHAVGMLVIDEAQNLANIKDSLALGNNEKTSVKFVEEIFNRFGIPLFFVGTIATEKLFGSEMTIMRRITEEGAFRMTQCDVNGAFWQYFCEQILPVHLLANQVTEFDIVCRHLHTLSQGIPAIAKTIAKATISALLNLTDSPKAQDLNIETLNIVMNEQFYLLVEPMKALAKGEYFAYEDFHCMRSIESASKIAEEAAITLLKNSSKVQANERSTQKNVEPPEGALTESESIRLEQISLSKTLESFGRKNAGKTQ